MTLTSLSMSHVFLVTFLYVKRTFFTAVWFAFSVYCIYDILYWIQQASNFTSHIPEIAFMTDFGICHVWFIKLYVFLLGSVAAIVIGFIAIVLIVLVVVYYIKMRWVKLNFFQSILWWISQSWSYKLQR